MNTVVAVVLLLTALMLLIRGVRMCRDEPTIVEAVIIMMVHLVCMTACIYAASKLLQ